MRLQTQTDFSIINKQSGVEFEEYSAYDNEYPFIELLLKSLIFSYSDEINKFV